MNLDQIQSLADRIMAAQRKRRAEKHRKIYEPRSTTASSLGYRCERRLVYARTHPHYADPISDELASILTEGNFHQAQVRQELIELGFEALQSERPFRDEELEIGGRIDGMLPLSDEHRAELIPVEIKSASGEPPKTAAAMRDHDGLYARYYAQMQIYLYLTATDVGVFLFKSKVLGLWTIVVVPLDYDEAELLLRKAERVRDHVREGTLPGHLADRSECPGCPFRDSICHPGDASVDPLLLVEDDQLLRDLKERERNYRVAKHWIDIDKRIKERFKLTSGERFIVGDEHGFLVTKKQHGSGIRIDIRRIK